MGGGHPKPGVRRDCRARPLRSGAAGVRHRLAGRPAPWLAGEARLATGPATPELPRPHRRRSSRGTPCRRGTRRWRAVVPRPTVVATPHLHDPEVVHAPHAEDLQLDLRRVDPPPFPEVLHALEPLARLGELQDRVLVVDLIRPVLVAGPAAATIIGTVITVIVSLLAFRGSCGFVRLPSYRQSNKNPDAQSRSPRQSASSVTATNHCSLSRSSSTDTQSMLFHGSGNRARTPRIRSTPIG